MIPAVESRFSSPCSHVREPFQYRLLLRCDRGRSYARVVREPCVRQRLISIDIYAGLLAVFMDGNRSIGMKKLFSYYKASLAFLVVAVAVVASTSFAGTANASGNLVVNGSFEDGDFNGAGHQLIIPSAAATHLPGWTIDSGSIDKIGSLWVASHEDLSIDLNSTVAGAISQNVPTTVGQDYLVTFDMAGNVAGTPVVKSLTATAAGSGGSFTFDTTGQSFANMGWEQKSFTFTATSTSTNLKFASSHGGAYGPALDNVSVVADDGPETLARTSWEMIGGNPIVSTPSFYPTHGHPGYYDYVGAIPAVDDPAWGPAPDGEIIGFGGPNASVLSGCWTSIDYTFFQTLVDIPLSTTLTSFTIEFSGMDDGSRITVFNSGYPTGLVVPGSYVYLGATATVNLASYMVAGETNRVVITQIDDCATGNNLAVARVVLNGDAIPAPVPTVEAVEIDVKPGSDVNPLNLNGNGVVPIAVLGSADLDVADIDPSTVAAGVDGDNASPVHGGHIEDVNGDGIDDIVFHFREYELGAVDGTESLTLTADGFGGEEFEGSDSVRINPNNSKSKGKGGKGPK